MKKNTNNILEFNKLQILTIVNAVGFVVLLALFIFYNFNKSLDIVYVDNTKLFNEFNMTKEMKRVGEKEFNARKTYLDSIYAKLQSNTISEEEKKKILPQFIKEKEDLAAFNQNFANIEATKIWTRINDYTAEYAKINNFKIVLGSQNQQNVLYAHEKIDKTSALIAFINKKYEGIK